MAVGRRAALGISRRVATDKNQSDRKRRANDHDVNPGVGFPLSLRSKIDIFRAFQSLRRQFKCPRDHERDRKADYNRQHDETHSPVRNFEKWKNLCSNLD